MAEHQKVCGWCGVGFVAGAANARFCSGTCRQAAWRAANPEKWRETDRAWRAANPERKRETDRAWKAANPEKQREAARAWKAANPEKQREAERAWKAANPEKQRDAKRAARRSKGPAETAFHILNVMKKLKTEGDT
jgi:hypothetical protein